MARRKKKVSVEDVDEYLVDMNPAVLDSDPIMRGKLRVGTKVVVVLPKFSRALKDMQREQFKSGKVEKFGQIALDDGKILNINESYVLPLTFEIKKLLKRGILMGGMKLRLTFLRVCHFWQTHARLGELRCVHSKKKV